MKKFLHVSLMILSLLVVTPSLHAQAQSVKLDIADSEDLRAILLKTDSKVVTVSLKSNKEITGKVYKVNEKLLHLTEISGKEFYDSIIALDDIEAVTVRAR